MSVILTVGSVTNAMRLVRLTERYVTRSVRAIHTPEQISGGGCSYSVTADMKYLADIAATAKKYGINVKKIYSKSDSEGESVYSDISG